MRILIWHGYLLDGTGSNVYTRALARAWSRAGHDVVVVCQEPHPEIGTRSSCAGIWARPFSNSSGSRVWDCSWEA